LHDRQMMGKLRVRRRGWIETMRLFAHVSVLIVKVDSGTFFLNIFWKLKKVSESPPLPCERARRHSCLQTLQGYELDGRVDCWCGLQCTAQILT
jgi:hypothetical protein